MIGDLNRLMPVISYGEYDPPPATAQDVDGRIVCHFDDIEGQVCSFLCGARAVVGCVAWLTSTRILEALANSPEEGTDLRFVSILVQKEDFLRPDTDEDARDSAWRSKLRGRYTAIEPSLNRYSYAGVTGRLSVCDDPTIEAIRCVGNHNSERKPAFPRMHHKFMVACGYNMRKDDIALEPYAVWTGSYNFTENASRSLENAVEIYDPVIARAYFRHWEHALSLSEPLDWTNPWCEPQWRIGS